MIIGTFNGWNIVGLPCDTIPRVTAPSSIEWDPQEAVAENECEFTMGSQVYDWMQSRLDGQVSFPPMQRWSHDAWAAFVRACRGPLNVFWMGDPKARLPKGSAGPRDVPLVQGAGQRGYTLTTRGWRPSVKGLLLFGDYISVGVVGSGATALNGVRLYMVTDQVDSDSSGHATIAIWPPVRDLPADGTAAFHHNCRGLFRLKGTEGHKDSVNVGAYGFSGFAIKEAL